MEPEQKSPSTLAVAAIALLIGGVLGWYIKPDQEKSTSTTNKTMESTSRENFNKDMRKLWEDHILWTRAYLVSAANGNKDTQDISERLLKNQDAIGNAITPYYGDEAGNKLTELLKTHITTAVDLVSAAKAGNKDAQNAANDKWYANANEIADFLASANTNWQKDDLRKEMKNHLDLTKQQAVDILSNKNEDGIKDYDKIHDQILTMADMLTTGIVKQFPDKFN